MIGRVITGVIVFAMGIAAIVVGGHISVQPLPAAVGTTVSVTPARQDVACPGPLVTPSGGTAADPELGGAATGVAGTTFLTRHGAHRWRWQGFRRRRWRAGQSR